MEKFIFCPNCRITYSVKEYVNCPVKCMDCGVMYNQEECDVDKTILDYVKPKKKE